MPKILLVKTSSMGDVIHNLPVASDIQRRIPDAIIDWVVEESFAPLTRLHPAVRDVIPVALRRWRSSLVHASTLREISAFRARLKAKNYGLVLDTQGLVKSALVARLARGTHCGYDWASAREPLASLFYQRRYCVGKNLHAVERNRRLAALAMSYELSALPLDYGIAAPESSPVSVPSSPYVVLLHASSRPDKQWREAHWIDLGRTFAAAGYALVLPWGSEGERQRSLRLAASIPHAQVPGALQLADAAFLIAHAVMVVGVDTGLTHLAAALGSKVIALYVATSPGLTGVHAGKQAINLGTAGKPPSVAEVWESASQLMTTTG
jgi:heptosyltransferase-1